MNLNRQLLYKARAAEQKPEIGEVLRSMPYLEARLAGANVLEAHPDDSPMFGFLLEWLRPSRLVTVELPRLCHAHWRSGPLAGPAGVPERDHAFDGVFMFLPARPCEADLDLREIGRVLAIAGVLIVTKPSAWGRGHARFRRLADRLSSHGFEIVEERSGPPGLLVANRRRSGASRKRSPMPVNSPPVPLRLVTSSVP